MEQGKRGIRVRARGVRGTGEEDSDARETKKRRGGLECPREEHEENGKSGTQVHARGALQVKR